MVAQTLTRQKDGSQTLPYKIHIFCSSSVRKFLKGFTKKELYPNWITFVEI